MVAENSRVWRWLRQLRADFLDVGDEAHVEHPVRLVDDEQVAAVEHDLAAAEQVHQPARRRDQHVDALFQRLDLVAHRDAADQQRHRELVILAVFLEILGDLRRRARGSARGSASAASARGCGPAPRMSIIGSTKPAVLPVPVWAMPMMSRIISTEGIAWRWIGVGSVIARFLTARSNSSERPRSAKVIICPGLAPASTAGVSRASACTRRRTLSRNQRLQIELRAPAAASGRNRSISQVPPERARKASRSAQSMPSGSGLT